MCYPEGFININPPNYNQNPQMNQKTLQLVYKTYETEEYFKRYLLQLGCRQDRRKPFQHRIVKVTAKTNSLVVSAGQTIIIANLSAQIQPVTFSPVSLSYGEPLLRLKVVSNSQGRHNRQNKSERAIQQFIGRQVNWPAIEDQLVGSDLNNGQLYGYKGEVSIRVLGDDGGVQDYSLLAVQLLLLAAKFKKFTVNKEKIELGDDFKLKIDQFLFPMKYSHIVGVNLTDPTLSQQQNCEFYVSFLKDVKKRSSNPIISHHFRRSFSKMTEQILKGILNQWQKDIQDITDSFTRLLIDLQAKGQGVLFAKQN